MTQQKGFPLRSTREALIERLQQNELRMRTQIRNLELERETLKYRLESLRKAKSIMVTQKERVRVSQTSFGTDHTSLPKLDLGTAHQSCDKQSSKKKVVSETTTTQPQSVGDMGLPQQEFEAALQLKWQHEAEMKQLKEESAAKQMAVEGLAAEVQLLRYENSKLVDKVAELIAANDALRACNVVLENSCKGLMDDLSTKEAQWTQREESLKHEIQKQWGERYHEWITKADKKMEELQAVNSMFQSLLKTHQHSAQPKKFEPSSKH